MSILARDLCVAANKLHDEERSGLKRAIRTFARRHEMYTVPEQVMTTQKDNLETFLQFAGITANAAEKLIELNLRTAKAMFADVAKNAKTLSEVKDAQELVYFQSGWTQPAVEKLSTYLKTTYGVVSETQSELSRFFEVKVTELNKNLVSALEKAAKNAPAGSEGAVAAVKSAFSVANQAYDALSKATRQVTEVTEATIAAATNVPTAAKKKAA
jgi:phasin family protein